MRFDALFSMIPPMSKRTSITQDALAQAGKSDNPGSAAAQIAILTKRIANLQAHLDGNKKDKHSRRGLLQMVADRRKLVTYLKRTNPDEYSALAKEFGLKA